MPDRRGTVVSRQTVSGSDPRRGVIVTPTQTATGTDRRRGTVVAKTHTKKGRHGLLGFVKNAGEDIAGIATGIGPGLIHTGKAVVQDVRDDPWLAYAPFVAPLAAAHFASKDSEIGEQVVRPMARNYKQTYGPLLPGGRPASDFLDELYGHPIGPMLDALTLASAGVGAGVKVGLISKVPRASYTVNGVTHTREVSRLGSGINKLTKIVDRHTDRFPDAAKFEIRQFARELKRAPVRDAARLELQMDDYVKATRGFSGRQFMTSHLIAMGVSPGDYRALLLRNAEAGETVNMAMVKMLADPKLAKLYDAPTPAVLKGAEESRKLSDIMADIYRQRGLLSDETDAARPYLSARIVSGAQRLPDTAKIAETAEAYRTGWWPGAAERATELDTYLAEAAALTDPAELAAFGRKYSVPTSLQGGKSIEAIKRDLLDTSRPEPFYFPHEAIPKRAINVSRSAKGGGVANPKPLGSTKQNMGTLFEMGMLALNADLLGPEFLNRVKFAYHQDLRAQLEQAAKKVAPGTPLEHGERYLLKPAHDPSQKIPYTEKIAGEAQEALLRDVRRKERSDVFSTEHPELAATDEAGNRLVVPEQLARAVAGEFTRANTTTRYVLEYPTKVWRYLVLGLRVGFLVNNLVGNHLIYAIKYAGHGGLRAYLNMVRTTHGADYVRRMLRSTSKARGGAISQQFMREELPTQVTGTFGRSQSPLMNSATAVGINNPVLRKAARIGGRANIVPLTQSLAETNLRRAMATSLIGAAPEVKAILRELPAREKLLIAKLPSAAKRWIPRALRETHDVEVAARKAFEKHPELERRISDKINDSLGDYLQMTPFERNGVRAIFPFYAWYRAIFRITFKLATDNPLRTVILTKFAQVDKEFQESLPVYLRGAASAGGLDSLLGGTRKPGTTTVLSTTGFNPFATVPQIGTALGAFVGASSTPPGQAIGGNLNPFLAALGEWLFAKDLYTGQDVPRTPGGFFGNVYGNVLMETPFAKLADPRAPSSVYPQRDRRSELLAYLGLPVKRANLTRARELENR